MSMKENMVYSRVWESRVEAIVGVSLAAVSFFGCGAGEDGRVHATVSQSLGAPLPTIVESVYPPDDTLEAATNAPLRLELSAAASVNYRPGHIQLLTFGSQLVQDFPVGKEHLLDPYTVELWPSQPLEHGRWYSVAIYRKALLIGDSYIGDYTDYPGGDAVDSTMWDFRVVQSITNPAPLPRVVSSVAPERGVEGVSTDTTLSIHLDKPVRVDQWTGAIELHRMDTDALVERFVLDWPHLSNDRRTVTVAPANLLEPATTYYVTFDRTALRIDEPPWGYLGDYTSYVGGMANNPSMWSFRTAEASDEVVEIASSSFTCARFRNGYLKCWGRNANGELGYGHTEPIGDDELPAATGYIDLGGDPVAAFALGSHHTCILIESGGVRCWGANPYGELGYGHTEYIGDDEVPGSVGLVPLGGEAVGIAAGGGHSCAILESGRVRCWGANTGGELGYGHAEHVGDNETPASAGDVNVGGAVIQLALGNAHTCALVEGGHVKCWGWNQYGQLGYGHTENIGDDESLEGLEPVDVGGNVIQLAAGGYHTCALLDTGRIRCWGYNRDWYSGALGYGHEHNIGDDELPSSAGDVDLGGTAVHVEAGNGHTCAILSTGNIRCWGHHMANGYGGVQVGDDEVPREVGDLDVGGAVYQVVAGHQISCVLLSGGRVRCWGANGALSYGSVQYNMDAAAAGDVQLFLPCHGKADGTVCNGTDYCRDGQCINAQWAHWPIPSSYGPNASYINQSSYIEDVHAGTVTNRVTGLEWSKSIAENLDWSAAVDYCASYQIGNVGQWRLPTLIELLSTVDAQGFPSGLPPAFPQSGQGVGTPYWTSTEARDSGMALTVGELGQPGAVSKESARHVRCVRTNTIVRSGGGYVTESETVLDERTGLEWARHSGEVRRTQGYAYCRDLATAGGGWRLPSLLELFSLVDFQRANPAIDLEAFPDTASGWYWVRGGFASESFYMDFATGNFWYTDDLISGYVRCVRGGCANDGHNPVELPYGKYTCSDN